MQCVDFFHQPLDSAIQQAKNLGDPLTVFLHIPKTAGSSVQRDLHLEFPNNRHIPCTGLEEKWDAFITSDDVREVHHVRGHISHPHLLKLEEKQIPIRVATFLRNPLSRLISHFNWVHTTINRQFLTSEPSTSFRQFALGRMDNYMTKRLVGDCESIDEALEKITKRFWFVGLTEYYHICQSILMKAMGTEYRIRQRENQTKKSLPTVELELDQELTQELNENMKIDFAVYEFFRNGWEKKTNEAVEQLIRSQPTPPKAAKAA